MNPTTPGINESDSLFATPVSTGRVVAFFAIVIGGTLTDLLTKHFIFGQHFRPHTDDGPPMAPEVKWWIEDWFGVQTSTNQGALFGMGQGYSLFFAALSIVAFCVLIYLLFFRRWANDLLITITFAMIAGGIFGNLYDRLGLWHGSDIHADHKFAVRDWIHFNWEGGPKLMNPWPNFNFADCLLVCGAILLCIHAFFIQPKLEAQASQTQTDT